MARRGTVRESGGSREDLTPMVDVVFLLLIFFLCATEFRAPEGSLRSWLPRDRGEAPGRMGFGTSCRIVLGRAGDRILCRADEVTVGEARGIADDAVSRDRAEFEARHGLRGPDFGAVERHIAKRKSADRGASPRGLSVVIDCAEEVPSRYVVDVVNICARLGIADVALAIPEERLD